MTNSVGRAVKTLSGFSIFSGKMSLNQTGSNEKKKRNLILKMVALPEKMLLILKICILKFYRKR
jgi:hypothetical protein